MFLKKNYIILILSFFILSFLPALAENFTDVGADYWANNSIQALSREGIISGYSDNTFKPNNPVTRAEFATMIIKAINREGMQTTGAANFRDVTPAFWAYNDIQRSYELGLIKGFPNNTFRPNSYITRAEVFAILSSIAQTTALSRSEAEQILSRFYDYNRVPDWAIIPTAKAVKANLIVNYPQPNFLLPEKNATRSEVAVMLNNLRNQLGLSKSSTAIVPGQQITQQPAIVDQITQAAASGATNEAVLRGSIATIQQNSVIPTQLESPLSSEIASVGDPISVRVTKNIYTSQGILLIPTGSRIQGNIASVTPAKLANKNASIDINFSSITLPSGQTFPLQASIATETGTLQAGSLKGQIGKGLLTTIGGAGAGAALGTALGAITGNTGKGAIYGTAIGGGLGVVGAILQRGGAIEIPSGEPLFIKLDRPLSIDTKTGCIIQ